MMMPLTFKNQSRGRPGPRSAGGFTIIELMAVLLIMLLLLAVLAPTVQKIYRTVLRSGSLATVHLIEDACKQYYEQMDNEYPPSNHPDYPGWTGRELLVLFVTGYGPDLSGDGTPGTNLSVDDGCEGFGFRIEKRGLRFGPYNGAEKVKTKRSANNRPVFVDSFDEEIYYYRYDALLPGYNADNPGGPIETLGSDYAQDQKDFILATRGPDGVFQDVDDFADTDDITNFLEE